MNKVYSSASGTTLNDISSFHSTEKHLFSHFRDPTELQAGFCRPTDRTMVYHSHFWVERHHLIIT